MLGARAVGKSSLVLQFIENTFAENYYPTIEASYNKSIRYRNQEYNIEVVDTAGQDEYSLINSKHSIGLHGYILVYSINSSTSLELIKTIRDKILNHTGLEWVPMVIVGNKCDLTSQRQVSVAEVSELATSWNAVSIEASAKTNHNIQRCFELMLSEVEKQNEPGKEKPSASECIIL